MLCLRCKSSDHTFSINGEQLDGHILAFLHKDSVYIRCSDRAHCNKWNKITIKIPGIKVDYALAAISQSVITDDKIKFPSIKAITVVDEHE